jgi:sugar O-acyltransferase (sialic acid O-acetyltransferase NeuD family)
MKVIIVGAGGHAQVIADALMERIKAGEDIKIIGFLDDDISKKGTKVLGIEVKGMFDDHKTLEFDHIVIGVGNNKIREKIFNQFQLLNYKFLTVIHPRSIIAEDVNIGEGTVVSAGAVINTGSTIGKNSIINTGATVDHHAIIGSHVHIAPGVHMGGTVHVGDGAFIGIGATVIQNVSIGDWSVIGAGSTLLSNIPPNVTAVGTPAKAIS